MKLLLPLSLFLSIIQTETQSYSILRCKCEQLNSQKDCEHPSYKCQWDNNVNKCSQAPNMIQVQNQYCDLFDQVNCLNQRACIWNSNKCMFFTDCTIFQKQTHEECQAISKRCMSNKSNCFEFEACSDSSEQYSCLINTQKKYCYWDDSENHCMDVTQCNQLPKSLKTDVDCRAQILWCTTKKYGGCTESGTSCQDQQSQEACVWNVDKTISCSWLNGQCIEKTCENAPNILTTDEACIMYKNDGTCTTKANGGCVTRTTCDSVTIEAACLRNNINEDCYWRGEECVDKICENAPLKYNTNQQCAKFKQGCITQLRGGCMKNGYCSVANSQLACSNNFKGDECVWTDNEVCEEKTCENSPSIINTNFACENYFPKNQCITKLGGGCIKNTTCSSIMIDLACEIDAKGNQCFWNQEINTCQNKICINAPQSYQNHEQCQQYMSICTVNELKNGCIDWTCEIINDQQFCLQKGDCKWKGPCSERLCFLASQTLNTFEGCQQYNTECTLDNAGKGCVQIPQLCQKIKIQQACRISLTNFKGTIVKKNCLWDGTQCVDFNCSTLDKTITTTSQCNSVISGCVSANPINQIVQGCMDLPQVCEERQSLDNCEVIRVGYPDCIWNSQQIYPNCVMKSCITAKIILSTFEFTSCNNYLNKCIANNDANGCMKKPERCYGLVESNCLLNSTILEDCYWLQNQNKCVEKKCDNFIGFKNHIECNSIMNTCTVNYNNNGCQQLQSTCTNYMSDAQCHFTLDQGKCIWTGFACRNSTCSDAPDSIEYDTDLECLAFPAVTEKCIVINKTGGMGCTSRQTDCSLYISKQQCNRTIASYINDCIWISQICIAKNQLTQFCGKFTTQDQCDGLQNQYLDYCSWYNNRCFGIFDKQIGTCGTQYGNQANCEFYNMGHNKEEMKIEKIDSTVFNCEQKDGFFVKPIDYYMCSPLKSTCYISWSNCQTLDGTCSLNNKATSCINKYANILRNVQISNNKRLVVVWQKYTPNVCGLIAYGFDCAYYRALPSDLSHQDCQNCSSLCTVVLDGTGCQENLKFCSNYQNLMSCTYSQNGRCIWTGISCIQIIDPKTQCSLINGNVESQNYNDCQKYNIGCSVNQNGSACIEKMKKCSDYSVSCVNPYANTCNCNYADEGECILIGSSCLKKTCDTASSNSQFNTDAECSAYLPTCTVARLGGCQALSQCNTYLSQKQCKFNSLGQKCFWNPSQMNCVDLQCQNIEQTNLFDSHIKCFNIDSKLQCTVRAIQGQINLGCQVRMNCKDYKIQEQCHYDAQGQECEWINNNTCFDKSCSTAPIIFSTHNECQSYLIDQKCTVAVKIDFEGDEYILQGCQPLVDCKKYKVIEQCIIDTQGQQCAWMENQCINKQCSTAPYFYSTDEQCQQYLNSTCITNYFNNGCITIPIKCENVKTQIECVKDKQGNKCFWNKSNCITRTCQNATEDIIDEQGCQQFMNGCSYNFEKCRTQICQDFQFKTDDECTKAMKSCTSDGVTCVKRGKCEDAQAQAGCVSAIDGTSCQWIQPGQCTIKIEKSCVKAPITFLTDSNCSSYLKSCTVKQGGGCIQKSNCENITYKEACYTALDGTQCLWINNSCISNNCNKLGGNNHNDCQVQNTNCTIGYNRQCTQIQLCKNTELQEACILGLDGPCKWIDQYINEQQKKGGCFLYYGCSSFQWKTDKECKMISHQCTTNGVQCIGITTCSKTNTNGGCVTGIDGDCIQFIASLVTTGPAVCKPYTSCADAFYLTHTACQTASSKCTTNGSTGCIPLAECSSYAQPGCVYNNVGVVQSSGAVISTGDCTWDTKALACRDKNCQDLVGTTHSQCYSQLLTCTSDGTNCSVKGNCSTYSTQTACAAAMGSDGICYWEAVSAINTTAKCRLMTCSDIPNGTSLQVCQTALSSCVSDGTNCISKANCQTYNRKTACNSGGSDGICVFAASTAVNATAETGSCSLMTACTVANNDQTACTAAKDRCKWLWLTTTINGKNSTTTTSCTTHTCESYQTTNGVCSRYFSWDKKTQQVCTTFNATCTATDPSTLPYANCFSLSGFTYTWNYAINQCDICRDDVAKNNTPNPSNTNTTTGNTTTSGYILGFASVVLGYLVF